MKKILYLLTITTALSFSCSELNRDVYDDVNIGVRSRNVYVDQLNPPLSIITPGSDSIDLNGDFQYDLIFRRRTIPITTGYAPHTEMTKKRGVQVVLSTVNYYPDALNYSVNLNTQENWSDDSAETMILQSFANRDQRKIIGNFVSTNEMYLGIKMGDSYGWVKLTNDITGALVISEYAMSLPLADTDS